MIVDSDVLIDIIQSREPVPSPIGAALERGELRTTVINVFELLIGANTPRHLAVTESLLQALHVYHLDVSAANLGARIARDLRVRGLQLSLPDALIAAIALQNDEPVLIRNVKDFELVPGLRVVRPGEI